MKTALFHDGTRMAVVLTPESDWETKILQAISAEGATVEIKEGNFNWTKGEYVRWFPDEYSGPYHNRPKPENHSIFLIVSDPERDKQPGDKE